MKLRNFTPLTCAEAAEPDALLCRGLAQLSPVATGTMMYMPAGLHTITPFGGMEGKGDAITVNVERSGVAALDRQRAAIAAKGKKAFVDFSHNPDADKAAFWIDGFAWQDAPEPGIYCRGEWTGSGRAAVEAKDYRYFSPVFHVDRKKGTSAKNPARIVCRDFASANMGGLVNEPAFHGISPLWAADALRRSQHSPGAAGSNQNQHTHTDMTTEELAALHAKNTELLEELNALKAKETQAKTKQENTELIESELKAKESELKAGRLEVALAASEAKTAKLDAEDLKRRTAHAEKFVGEMITRGAIAAKDDKIIADAKKNMTDNPDTFEPLYAKWAGNAALTGRITHAPAQGAQRFERGQMGAKDTLQEYAALVAKNAAIPDRMSADKSSLAKEAGALFCSELKGREIEWLDMPLRDAIKASDVTSAAVGTLAGTLVLQRNLPLLAFAWPMLKTLFADFSDAVGLWQQTEITRIPIKPAVTEYDATLDSNGRPKGFVVVTPGQSVDVPITLSKHVGIPMIFGVQTLASTARDLFGEQAAGAINALGGYFVAMATALMTAANFNAYKQITDAGCVTTSGSTTISLATTAGVYKGQAISGTGIPTGTHIASVVDGTTAVMTIAATASATVTATLGGGLVPTLYPTYVKAAADFNFASLGEIGAAFDNNEVPYAGRSVMLNATYYSRLTQDPTVNNFFAATRSPDIINKGLLPELNGFVPQKAPWFPTSSSRVGFAYMMAAIALKSRLPQDFAGAVNAPIPGTIITVTDPDTKLSVLNTQRVDLVGRYAESLIESMLGAAPGDPRAGMVLTSA